MALTYVQYTGDGVTKQYTLSFPYLSKDHVFVRVDGTSVPFTWLNDSTVVLDTAPEIGQVLSIYRATPRYESLVTFKAGAGFREQDLNLMTTQVFYIVQESLENLDTDELYLWRTETLAAKNIAVLAKSETEQYRNESMAFAHAASVSAASVEDYKDLTVAAAQVLPWDIGTTYNFPTLVARPNGHTYRCIGNGVIGEPVPEDSAHWVAITSLVSIATDDSLWVDGLGFGDSSEFDVFLDGKTF